MFDSVVFAGGGHRCWWQLGWWDVVAPVVGLAPNEITGVSAGAATACLIYANDANTALDYYRRTLGPGARNFHPLNLTRAGARVFPHEAIYRRALSELLGGPSWQRLIATAPRIAIMYAHPPARWHPVLAQGVGLFAYNLEKYWRRPLHPTFGRRLGFTSGIATLQSCRDEQALIDLIIASSSTPPFTAAQRIAGRTVLDGGLVDNVPVAALVPRATGDESSVLVLLTRRYSTYPPVFEHAGRVYVQPSRKVAASSWDYTAPDTYRDTYQQGREDAVLFLRWKERQTGR